MFASGQEVGGPLCTEWGLEGVRDMLNLPMAKARGFRTHPHGCSRGPFRPRYGASVATPPVALDHILPRPFLVKARRGLYGSADGGTHN